MGPFFLPVGKREFSMQRGNLSVLFTDLNTLWPRVQVELSDFCACQVLQETGLSGPQRPGHFLAVVPAVVRLPSLLPTDATCLQLLSVSLPSKRSLAYVVLVSTPFRALEFRISDLSQGHWIGLPKRQEFGIARPILKLHSSLLFELLCDNST